MALGDYETALENAGRAVTHLNVRAWVYSTHLVAAVYGGTDADVESTRFKLLNFMPKFTCRHFPDNFPATDPHLRKIYLDDLRKAGIPEE